MEYREGDESYGEQRERTENRGRERRKMWGERKNSGKWKGKEEKKVYIASQNIIK